MLQHLDAQSYLQMFFHQLIKSQVELTYSVQPIFGRALQQELAFILSKTDSSLSMMVRESLLAVNGQQIPLEEIFQ